MRPHVHPAGQQPTGDAAKDEAAAKQAPASAPAAGAYPGTTRLAVTLAGVSGYGDGVGATLLAEMFVSFMSGNTAATGLAVGQAQWARAAHTARIPPPRPSDL